MAATIGLAQSGSESQLGRDQLKKNEQNKKNVTLFFYFIPFLVFAVLLHLLHRSAICVNFCTISSFRCVSVKYYLTRTNFFIYIQPIISFHRDTVVFILVVFFATCFKVLRGNTDGCVVRDRVVLYMYIVIPIDIWPTDIVCVCVKLASMCKQE